MVSDSMKISGLTLLLVLLHWFCFLFFTEWQDYRIRKIQVEQDKIKVEMRVRKECQQEQQEQVEESTVTCPRCMKEFELDEQPPEYKKQQRRTPAPCGTIR